MLPQTCVEEIGRLHTSFAMTINYTPHPSQMYNIGYMLTNSFIVYYVYIYYYMLFSRSQVLLWKFLYQIPSNMYANMHRKLILFPALWLVGNNSNIRSCHHSDLRSHSYSIRQICYFHYFINLCWIVNLKSNKVHNFRKLGIQLSWSLNM